MDINERREALRARVREKLSGEEPETEELVVQETEVIAATTEGKIFSSLKKQMVFLRLHRHSSLLAVFLESSPEYCSCKEILQNC